MTVGVRCLMMRGGSSKGAYFLADDLPESTEERDDLLRRIMGSPDPRQIDGVGGAHPLTSKVAVISPSADGEADVDYLFLQVGVDDNTVSDRQNCGNLLAGVGPFAIERDLLANGPTDGEITVRIKMVNTNSVATARFMVADGQPVYDAPTAGSGVPVAGVPISGVPGTAAPIQLEFEGLAGGSTGALLPTGSTVDVIDGVPCTLIDNGMPVVVLDAASVGVTGHESCEQLERNTDLRAVLEGIRLKAGPLMNLGDVTGTTVPKLTMVAPPRAGGHLSTRTFIPHRCHDAIGVLGAVSVASAALLDGSVANGLLVPPDGSTVRLEHPTGFFDTVVDAGTATDGTVRISRAGIIRTARKLMDGVVFPRAATTLESSQEPEQQQADR